MELLFPITEVDCIRYLTYKEIARIERTDEKILSLQILKWIRLIFGRRNKGHFNKKWARFRVHFFIY